MNKVVIIIMVALFLIAVYFAVKYHVLKEKVKMYRVAGSTKEDATITVEKVEPIKPKPETGKPSFFTYE